MTDLLAELVFPPEWYGGKTWLPGFPELVQTYTHDELPGETFFVAGGVLEGGANLLGLAWSSGQHIARCGPPLWALEERVDPDAPAATRSLWRHVVDSMVRGYRDARVELGGPRS